MKNAFATVISYAMLEKFKIVQFIVKPNWLKNYGQNYIWKNKFNWLIHIVRKF